MSAGFPTAAKSPGSATSGASASGSTASSGAWRKLVEAVRRVPGAGRACFVIAFVNAAVWGIVVPPFQVPDETAHFAYAQYLAETGKPPPEQGSPYSPQEASALRNLFFGQVIGHPQIRGVITNGENKALRTALARHPSPVGGGGNAQANQPPLYYAIEAIPYWLSPSHDILTRLALMRLVSALIAAGTVLAIFMFLRELLPQFPWAWTVGALVVAFQPMFNFIAAGVQSDNLLYFTSALTFFLLMSAYRRGLTDRRAAAIGLVTAAGVLSKLTFIGLIPGVALAVALLVRRASEIDRRGAIRMLSLAAGAAAAPILLYTLLNETVWHRGGPTAGGLAIATVGTGPTGQVITLRETLSYLWQFYLPRLPMMHNHYFPGTYPVLSIWIDGSIGRFGWLDYGFSHWVYDLGRYLLALFASLAVIGAFAIRVQMRRVLPIFICFGVMAFGLLGEIGYSGIRYRIYTGFQFEQARYLFPLLGLYATFIVLVARGVGRRWAPVLGAGLVVLAMAHGLFAETLTVARYYG